MGVNCRISSTYSPSEFWLCTVGAVFSIPEFPDEPYFGGAHKTLTHEIGHCLGLWHTFHAVDDELDVDLATLLPCADACRDVAGSLAGDTTGDFCSDTAPTPMNFACTEPTGADPCSGIQWAPTDPQNYMSYAADSCYTEFSAQQSGRCHCWIADSLTSWTAPNCLTVFNDGLAFLNVTSIDRPAWATLERPSPFSIPAGSTKQVCVSVDCGQCVASDPIGTLDINSNDPDTPSLIVSMGVTCPCGGVVCTPLDQCHDAGTCDPSTGKCTDPAKPNGTTCDDGQFCTVGEMCLNCICGNSSPTCLLGEVCDESSDFCIQAPTAVGVGSRYVKIEVNSSDPDVLHAIRFQELGSALDKFVDTAGIVDPDLHDGTGQHGTLVDNPTCLTSGAWQTVYVSDAPICPGTAYSISVGVGAAGALGSLTFSNEVSATTHGWGDLKNDGRNRIDDVLLALDGATITVVDCIADIDCPSSVPWCDAKTNSCVECMTDIHCEDGLFCTGIEVCNNRRCGSIGEPCPSLWLVCDETSDECLCAEYGNLEQLDQLVNCLDGPGAVPDEGCDCLDVDDDGDVDLEDFALFQAAFTGGP